jgi:hypothetical protein
MSRPALLELIDVLAAEHAAILDGDTDALHVLGVRSHALLRQVEPADRAHTELVTLVEEWRARNEAAARDAVSRIRAELAALDRRGGIGGYAPTGAADRTSLDWAA